MMIKKKLKRCFTTLSDQVILFLEGGLFLAQVGTVVTIISLTVMLLYLKMMLSRLVRPFLTCIRFLVQEVVLDLMYLRSVLKGII